MTTIPTIANRSMLRGLIGWNENHYEKWKVKICGEAGEALMDFISDEFTEPGARGAGDLKDYIPEEDVKEGDYTEKLCLQKGLNPNKAVNADFYVTLMMLIADEYQFLELWDE